MENYNRQQQMITRYFKIGDRPVYAEEMREGYKVYAFNWRTGTFDEDASYHPRIYYGPRTGETDELTKQEFDLLVNQLKQKIK